MVLAWRGDTMALGRVVKQTRTLLYGVDYVAEKRYDAGGRERGITYPDGDAVGTPASPLGYDAAGWLRSIPGIVNEIVYDASGRPARQTNANGTVTTRTYSPERGFLLAQMDTTVPGPPVQTNSTRFTYDGLGERIKKVSPWLTSIQPLGDDYEVTNGVIFKYVSVDGLGVVAKRIGSPPSVSTFWLHTDRLGSIQAVTDATGAEIQRRTYRPYGEKIADTTSHWESRGWIDQRTDPETTLTYLHARYYSSAAGLFLSPDPMEPYEAGVGLNRYAYGAGNPISYVDRSGLRMILVCFEGVDNVPYCFLTHGGSVPVPPGGTDRQPRPPGGGQPIPPGNTPATPPANPGASCQSDDCGNTGTGTAGSDPNPKKPEKPSGSTTESAPSTLSYHQVEQRLAAFWDGFDPFGDPFEGLYDDCPECWMSEMIGELTFDAEMSVRGGIKLGIHGPHHNFRLFGRLPHAQITLWIRGMRGSHNNIRIPFPRSWRR